MKVAHDPIRAGDQVFVMRPDGSFYEDNRFRDIDNYWRAYPDATELRIWRSVHGRMAEVRRIVHPKERMSRRIPKHMTYHPPVKERVPPFITRR